jgi:hypothetical protein
MKFWKCLVPFGTQFYDFSFATKNMKIEAYSTKILHVILHEWETWSLILGEEDKLGLWEHGIKEYI